VDVVDDEDGFAAARGAGGVEGPEKTTRRG
jgi:hypothetical protein